MPSGWYTFMKKIVKIIILYRVTDLSSNHLQNRKQIFFINLWKGIPAYMMLNNIFMPLHIKIVALNSIIMPLNSIIMPLNITIMLLNIIFMPLVQTPILHTSFASNFFVSKIFCIFLNRFQIGIKFWVVLIPIFKFCEEKVFRSY